MSRWLVPAFVLVLILSACNDDDGAPLGGEAAAARGTAPAVTTAPATTTTQAPPRSELRLVVEGPGTVRTAVLTCDPDETAGDLVLAAGPACAVVRGGLPVPEPACPVGESDARAELEGVLGGSPVELVLDGRRTCDAATWAGLETLFGPAPAVGPLSPERAVALPPGTEVLVRGVPVATDAGVLLCDSVTVTPPLACIGTGVPVEGEVTAASGRRGMVVVGDSVMLGARRAVLDEFSDQFDVAFDAEVNRTTGTALGVFERLLGPETSVAVMHIGHNDAGSESRFAGQAEEIVAAAEGVDLLVLVGLRENRPYYLTANDSLRAAAEPYPWAVWVDWNAQLEGTTGNTAGDGLHLTGAGADLMARFLRSVIDEDLPAADPVTGTATVSAGALSGFVPAAADGDAPS